MICLQRSEVAHPLPGALRYVHHLMAARLKDAQGTVPWGRSWPAA